jgi:hypothetical protein
VELLALDGPLVANSDWAQGGIIYEPGDPARLGADIVAASDGTSNPAAVEQLVREGPAAVKELLLVPFVGACIHVPPPPSNQVIHVMAQTAFKMRDLFDPVWVTGVLTIVQSSTELADASYALAAESVSLR